MTVCKCVGAASRLKELVAVECAGCMDRLRAPQGHGCSPAGCTRGCRRGSGHVDGEVDEGPCLAAACWAAAKALSHRASRASFLMIVNHSHHTWTSVVASLGKLGLPQYLVCADQGLPKPLDVGAHPGECEAGVPC